MSTKPLTFINDFLTSTDLTASRPQTVRLADGTFLVAYATQAETGFVIKGQVLDNAGNFIGEEITFDIARTIDSPIFDIAALSGGNVVITVETDNFASIDVPVGADESAYQILDTVFDLSDGTPEAIATDGSGTDVFSTTYSPVLVALGEDSYRRICVETNTGGVERLIMTGMDNGVPIQEINLGNLFVNGSLNGRITADVLKSGNIIVLSDPDGNTSTANKGRLEFRIVEPDGTRVFSSLAINVGTSVFDSTVTALEGGGFVVSWAATDRSDTDLFVRMFDADGLPTTPGMQFGDTSGVDDNRNPDIVALEDGGFVLFYDKNGGADAIRGQRFNDKGGRVGASFTVVVVAGGQIDAVLLPGDRLAVTYNPNGNTGVHTEILTLNPEDIVAQTAQVLTESFSVNTSGAGAQSEMVLLGNGNVLVAYAVNGEEGFRILGQQFDADGNRVGGEVAFGFPLEITQREFAMDVMPGGDGNRIVVGIDAGKNFGDPDYFGRVFDIDATGNVTVIERLDAEGVIRQGSPEFSVSVIGENLTDYRLIIIESNLHRAKVVEVTMKDGVLSDGANTVIDDQPGNRNGETFSALLENGNNVVVVDTDGDRGGIAGRGLMQFVVRFPNGATIRSGQFGNPDAKTSDGTITALKRGGFAVAWTEKDTSDRDIFYQLFNNQGQSVTGRIQYGDTNADDNNDEPELVALEDGGFVLFYDQDLSSSSIRGQRFDSLGRKVGNEFVVYSGAAFNVDAAAMADGRIAVTYNVGEGSIETTIVGLDLNEIADIDEDETIDGGNDALEGNDGDDDINGSAGDDTIDGGNGNDTISGKNGDDVINGGNGDDFLDGQGHDDVINGGNGNDTLFGRFGDDVIDGGGGNDIINGGGDSDTLTGGGGNNRFVFANGDRGGEGGNVITDFTANSDQIDFSGFGDINSFADLQTKMVQSGNDVHILNDRGLLVVTLKDVNISALDASDFIF